MRAKNRKYVNSVRGKRAGHSRSVVSEPSAGEPAAHVLNSQAVDKGVGVVVDEPDPDLFSAGAERIIYRLSVSSNATISRQAHTLNPAALNALYWSRIWATAQPSSFVNSILLCPLQRVTEERSRKAQESCMTGLREFL